MLVVGPFQARATASHCPPSTSPLLELEPPEEPDEAELPLDEELLLEPAEPDELELDELEELEELPPSEVLVVTALVVELPLLEELEGLVSEPELEPDPEKGDEPKLPLELPAAELLPLLAARLPEDPPPKVDEEETTVTVPLTGQPATAPSSRRPAAMEVVRLTAERIIARD